MQALTLAFGLLVHDDGQRVLIALTHKVASSTLSTYDSQFWTNILPQKVSLTVWPLLVALKVVSKARMISMQM
jgi:hypothetical protein